MNCNNNRGSKERIHSLFFVVVVVIVVVVVVLKLLPSDQGEYFYRDNDRGSKKKSMFVAVVIVVVIVVVVLKQNQIFLQSRETKSGTESLGSRLAFLYQYVMLVWKKRPGFPQFFEERLGAGWEHE